MQIKILVKTPDGQAIGVEQKLKPFLLGLKRVDNIYVNDKQNELCWVVSGNSREIMKITNNVFRFEQIMKLVVNNKYVKKLVHQHLTIDEYDTFYEMMLNNTKVEIIREASLNDLVNKPDSVFNKFKDFFIGKRKQENNLREYENLPPEEDTDD